MRSRFVAPQKLLKRNRLFFPRLRSSLRGDFLPLFVGGLGKELFPSLIVVQFRKVRGGISILLRLGKAFQSANEPLHKSRHGLGPVVQIDLSTRLPVGPEKKAEAYVRRRMHPRLNRSLTATGAFQGSSFVEKELSGRNFPVCATSRRHARARSAAVTRSGSFGTNVGSASVGGANSPMKSISVSRR